jgi:hypothetical protein
LQKHPYLFALVSLKPSLNEEAENTKDESLVRMNSWHLQPVAKSAAASSADDDVMMRR